MISWNFNGGKYTFSIGQGGIYWHPRGVHTAVDRLLAIHVRHPLPPYDPP